MVEHFDGGCKGQCPFANKKILYLIGLRYAIFIPFLVKSRKLTQDLLREKHGKAFWWGIHKGQSSFA